MPTSLDNDRCFDSVDTVLVDGANGACRRPAPATDVVSPVAIAVSVVLMLASAVVFVRRSGTRRRLMATVLGVLCVIAASVPGLTAVWLRRADAPAHIAETSAAVARFASQVERFSAARGGCVDIVQRGCIACMPVLRYARPTVRNCVAPRGRVIVEDGALAAGCFERSDTLVCGGSR